MWFDIGSQQGAGARTRLKSSIKKFEPHFIYDFFLFSLLFFIFKGPAPAGGGSSTYVLGSDLCFFLAMYVLFSYVLGFQVLALERTQGRLRYMLRVDQECYVPMHIHVYIYTGPWCWGGSG